MDGHREHGKHGNQSDMAEHTGQQIGEYRLVRLLGTGEFAEVYLGEHSQYGALAAIKLLHTSLHSDEARQFLAQVPLLTQLDHPHIARILSYGIANNTPYLVMDYAPHGSLRQRHSRGSRLPLATVVTYVRQIADALQYIHDRNLIHRDIKPHNILIGANHELLLSDFGIAVISQSVGYRRQSVQDFEGTILYAAPEQIRSMPRIQSDQYALGVVVYEWLCGNWPFRGTVDEIASQHVLAPPPSLLAKVPTLPPAVEQVVFKALAKDPYQRFESVQEFARALERASRLDGTRSPSSPDLPPVTPSIAKTPSSSGITATPATPAASPVVTLTYRGHSEKIHQLAWSPDGQYIASSSLDETIQVWNAQNGTILLTQRSNSLQPQVFAWSPDSQFIASTTGLLSDTLHVWNVATGQVSSAHAHYRSHEETVRSIAWSPDGTYIASAGDDRSVHIWNVATGRAVFTYRGHTAAVKTLAWSPDGKRIASGGDDKRVHTWNALTGGNIAVYYAHLDTINAVAWSRGGSHIASASDDKTVHIWDSSTARKVLVYPAHSGGVTGVAWSPDGIRVASSSRDDTVHLWHALTARTGTIFTGHSDWVSTVAWSPDGKTIASGSWDKTVQVWSIVP